MGEFNICFNLIHFDHIVSDQSYNGSYINNIKYTEYDATALQIFVPNDYFARGQAWFDEAKNVTRRDQIDTGILIHEVGHNLGLRHTHRGWQSSNLCESVTRDVNDPDYNADVAGDYVIDTNAAPEFYQYLYLTPNCQYYDDDEYVGDGEFLHCDDEPYNLDIEDIQNFMAWTHCPETIFTTGQKIRMHETIQNCQSTFSNVINDNAVELASKNSDVDYSIEPDNQTNVIWESPDIWVRNQSDGFTVQEHEDLEFVNSQTPVYVYVKVRNIGCDASSGQDELKLYWAKGGLSQDWPTVWEGEANPQDENSNEFDIGDYIGLQTIPSIPAGESTILEFEWQPLNPDVYENAGFNKPWMFCFLSRIVSSDDPMTYSEVSDAAVNTRNNNNIAYKNTTVENIGLSGEIGSIFAGNFNTKQNIRSNINFFTLNNSTLLNEAEVRINLNEDLWELWQSSGGRSKNVRVIDPNTREIILTSNNASLQDIDFDSGDWGILSPKVNFLIKEVTNENEYNLYVSQTESSSDNVLGGYTYNIHRDKTRSYFEANADSSNEGAELSAQDINEAATYNWYDEDGKLISTGETLTLNNLEDKEYKLEVIAVSDGHKDYKSITAESPFKIKSISPNPASALIDVEYIIPKNSSTTYLSISNSTGLNINNYLLTENSTCREISTTALTTGIYIVSLVHDGNIIDSKQLIKN